MSGQKIGRWPDLQTGSDCDPKIAAGAVKQEAAFDAHHFGAVTGSSSELPSDCGPVAAIEQTAETVSGLTGLVAVRGRIPGAGSTSGLVNVVGIGRGHD